MLPLLALVIAALLLPATAGAKVTCAEPARPAEDAPLRGLPDAPITGRDYRLTAVLRPDAGVNPTPHLAAEYCGRGVAHEAAAGAGGWFRARGGGVYALVLRFDRAGPWALSFMDRHGMFHPLGFLHVRPRGEAEPLTEQPHHDLTPLASLALELVLWIFELG